MAAKRALHHPRHREIGNVLHLPELFRGMLLIVEIHNSTANPFVLTTVWEGEQVAGLYFNLYKKELEHQINVPDPCLSQS